MNVKKQKRKSKRNFSKVIHTLVKSIKFIFDFLQLLKSIMEFSIKENRYLPPRYRFFGYFVSFDFHINLVKL